MTPTNDQLADALRELMELLYVHGGALPYNAVINIRKRLEPPCPTTNDDLPHIQPRPAGTLTGTFVPAASKSAEPEPSTSSQTETARDARQVSQWPLPPRPEKSAAREPGQRGTGESSASPTSADGSPRGGDGSSAGLGGTGGNTSSTSPAAVTMNAPAAMASAAAADAHDPTSRQIETDHSRCCTSSATSAEKCSPAADPVGVPEMEAVVNESDRAFVDINGLSHDEVACSGFFARNVNEADDAAFIINTAFTKLRQHHERVVAGLKSQLRDVEDAPIARLQLPDGTVPANTVDAAQQWYAEANRVMAERDSFRERCERAERERDHWKAMCEGHETFKEALDTPSSPTVTAKGERWKRGKDIYELVNGRPEFIHTPTQDRFQSTDYPTESDLCAAVARGELVRVEPERTTL